MALPFFDFKPKPISSPGEAERARKVAEALVNKPKATNWAEGLAAVTGAYAASQLNNRASDAEQAGQASAAEALSRLSGGGTQADIIAALSNPWLSQPQASVASALLGQQLERQDPLYQLRLQQAQLDYEQDLAGPAMGDTEYFGSTLPYQDANGNLQYVQLSKGGLPQLPDGARWLEPTSTVNTGTAQTVIGRNTGAPVAAIPIDNLGAAQDTAVGTGLGQAQITTIEAGKNASSNNAKLDILEETLTNAPQGATGALVQAAGSIGIPVEGLDDVQAAQAIINQMVPLQRAPGSGTMSDADLALFKQSLPSIINQPGGNAKIIATLRALNDYTIEHARIEEDVARRRITPDEATQRKAQIPNPLANFQASTSSGITIRKLSD